MLVDDDEYSLLDSQQQEVVEKTFKKAPWLLDILDVKDEISFQQGGSPAEGSPAEGSPAEGSPAESRPTAADVSLDKMVNWIIQKTTAADEYMEKVKKGNPINRMLNTPVPIYPATTFRPIVTLLISLVDMIRLSAAAAGDTNIPLTLLVLLEELIEGKWRQMILTSLGFISPSGAAAGILLKLVVDVWLLADPGVRSDYFRKSMGLAKSTFTGLILWMGNLLTPPLVKMQVTQRVKGFIEPILSKVEGAKKRISDEKGKPLEFPGLETDGIRKFAEGDLSQFPSVLRFTPLICSQEGQKVIQQIQKVPYMQLLLELLNVPTTAQGKTDTCGPTLGKPLGEAIKLKFQDAKVTET